MDGQILKCPLINFKIGFDFDIIDGQITLKKLFLRNTQIHLSLNSLFTYDTPMRDELYPAINHFGNKEKLIRLCQLKLRKTWSCVRAALSYSFLTSCWR
uniref:Uncharacterized protein n=1 Tax=Megaselia scalaris TaxID=36166 RepID=T1GUX2_MEGSC